MQFFLYCLSGVLFLFLVTTLYFKFKKIPIIYQYYSKLKPVIVNNLSKQVIVFYNKYFDLFLFSKLGFLLKSKNNELLKIYFSDELGKIITPCSYATGYNVLCNNYQLNQTKLFAKWNKKGLFIRCYAVHTTNIYITLDKQLINYNIVDDFIRFNFKKFNFTFLIKNCQFNIERKENTILLKIRVLSGNSELKFLYNYPEVLTLNSLQQKNIIHKLFALKDVKSFDNRPDFKNSLNNKLKQDYAKQCLINTKYIYTNLDSHIYLKVSSFKNFKIKFKEKVLINLSELGFTKFIKIYKKNNIITLQDIFNNNYAQIYSRNKLNSYKLECVFEIVCLYLESNQCEIEYRPFKLDIINLKNFLNFDTNNLKWNNILNKDYKINFLTILETLNKAILLGKLNNIDFFKPLILKNFSKEIQFEIYNCILSFIKVNDNIQLLLDKSISKGLLKTLLNIKTINSKNYCFIKKILPYIKKEAVKKFYSKFLYQETEFNELSFEYIFTEILGVNLKENSLNFQPKGNIDNLKINFNLRNSNVLIEYNKGRNIILNNVKLFGFNYFLLEPSMNIVYN